jgi:MoaA/NifB/PqqE/SkfB family radical SAM enzyme
MGSLSVQSRATGPGYGQFQRFDQRDYVSMTMEFRCNLRCVHCMIEGTMDRLAPESADRFDELLAHNAQNRRWKGLILTGSEITLRRDLPELARRARAAGFQHVRIQTHGMHLAQPAYCDALLDAGVDEYFVSVAGPDAETHDAITTVPGSFEKTLRGLEILDGHAGAVTLTNTVVTSRSFHLLEQVVDRLAHLRNLVQMEFWVYWPMSETDEKDLIAPHAEIAPYLRAAVARGGARRRGEEFSGMSSWRRWGGADEHAAAAFHRSRLLAGIHAQRLLSMRVSRPLRLHRMSGAEHGLYREIRL